MVIEVSAIEVASTILRRPWGGGKDGAILRLPGQCAVERDHVGRCIDAAFEQALDAADFAGAGQKHQDRAAVGAHRPGDGVGDLRLDRARIAAEIAGLDGKGAALARDHRGVAEKLGDAGAVDGCRHDEELEVLAQALLGVARQGEPEIGVERALVKLVEQHRGNAAERRIVENEPREDALGDDFDAGLARDL